MKIITWNATYDGCRHDARLDLCLAHSERAEGDVAKGIAREPTPGDLPTPVQVYRGAHEGQSCDWCELESMS